MSRREGEGEGIRVRFCYIKIACMWFCVSIVSVSTNVTVPGVPSCIVCPKVVNGIHMVCMQEVIYRRSLTKWM